MSLKDALFRIEEGFWLRGEEFFLDGVENECLLAFPQMQNMPGIFSREDVAATASGTNRWHDLRISNRRLLELGEGVAIISYRADVRRVDGEPYSALVSSAYVLRQNGWKLAFHQHALV